MLERLETDILILGSGGAGLFAALHDSVRGHVSDVPILLTKVGYQG